MFTPYEKFKSLPQAEHYLTPGVTFNELDQKANIMSDTEAARQMNAGLKLLFNEIIKSKERNELVDCKSA